MKTKPLFFALLALLALSMFSCDPSGTSGVIGAKHWSNNFETSLPQLFKSYRAISDSKGNTYVALVQPKSTITQLYPTGANGENIELNNNNAYNSRVGVIKIDQLGKVVWATVLGDENSTKDIEVRDIQRNGDNGVILVANQQSTSGLESVIWATIDASGNMLQRQVFPRAVKEVYAMSKPTGSGFFVSYKNENVFQDYPEIHVGFLNMQENTIESRFRICAITFQEPIDEITLDIRAEDTLVLTGQIEHDFPGYTGTSELTLPQSEFSAPDGMNSAIYHLTADFSFSSVDESVIYFPNSGGTPYNPQVTTFGARHWVSFIHRESITDSEMRFKGKSLGTSSRGKYNLAVVGFDSGEVVFSKIFPLDSSDCTLGDMEVSGKFLHLSGTFSGGLTLGELIMHQQSKGIYAASLQAENGNILETAVVEGGDFYRPAVGASQDRGVIVSGRKSTGTTAPTFPAGTATYYPPGGTNSSRNHFIWKGIGL